MTAFLELLKVKPVIDHVYSFGEAVHAFEHVSRALRPVKLLLGSLTCKCCLRQLAKSLGRTSPTNGR
jgi:hypothetical protein